MVGIKFSPAVISSSKSLSLATTGTGTTISFHDCRQVFWTVEGAGTISGGTVKIESAASADYAGTWNEIDSITASTLTGGAAYANTTPMTGGGFFRARISSNITGGGTITVSINGLLQ